MGASFGTSSVGEFVLGKRGGGMVVVRAALGAATLVEAVDAGSTCAGAGGFGAKGSDSFEASA
jgi:hypothetical protein